MNHFPLISIISVIALSFGQSSIIYHQFEIRPPGPPGIPLMLDLDNDGLIDLEIQARSDSRNTIRLELLRGSKIAIVTGESILPGLRGPIPLQAGFEVDALGGRPLFSYFEHTQTDPAVPELTVLATYNGFAQDGSGEFYNHRAFLGFRFDGENGPHYGYVELDGRRTTDFAVYSYAYQTEPNTPILTGAIPEPSTALFLMLLPGLAMRRKRESKRLTKTNLPPTIH